MLMTVIAAIVVFGLLFAGMAVGVIFSNKPIKGSCGGLANVGIQGECEICGGDMSKCDESDGDTDKRPLALGYDANLAVNANAKIKV